VITQLNPRNLGATVRATNKRLTVAFINADLPSRVGPGRAQVRRPV
jgi:hypothetical protein